MSYSVCRALSISVAEYDCLSEMDMGHMVDLCGMTITHDDYGQILCSSLKGFAMAKNLKGFTEIVTVEVEDDQEHKEVGGSSCYDDQSFWYIWEKRNYGEHPFRMTPDHNNMNKPTNDVWHLGIACQCSLKSRDLPLAHKGWLTLFDQRQRQKWWSELTNLDEGFWSRLSSYELWSVPNVASDTYWDISDVTNYH